MRTRSELQRELVDMAARAASLADHIVRAAQEHDPDTIQDLTPFLSDVAKEMDQSSFALSMMRR